jgi:hypothetical protein
MTKPAEASLRQAPDTIHVSTLVWTSFVALGVFAIAVGVAWGWTSLRAPAHTRPTIALDPLAGVDRDLLEGTGRGFDARAQSRAELTRSSLVEGEEGVARISIKQAMQWIVDGVRPEGAPPITAPEESE